MGHKSLYKQEETFYKDIYELPPASIAVINSSLDIQTLKYWEPRFSPQEMTEQEAIEGIRERMVRAVELRMRADVPLAFCLSGGVDSSSIVSIAAKELKKNVKTFSIIDQDARYNEKDNISATLADIECEPTFIELSPKVDYLSQLKKLVEYHDAPVATISYLVHSLISQEVSRHGYKISISGTAADELFHRVLRSFQFTPVPVQGSSGI